MKNSFDKNRSIFLLGLGLSFLWLVLLAYFNTLYETRYQDYLNQQHVNFNDEIDTILNSYESFSNYIFETMIDQNAVYEIMESAAKGDEAQKAVLREQLYLALNDDYQIISEHGFEQMQFHLPDGTSFLRFHAPDQYGDDLKAVRESIAMVLETQEPVTGFEVGSVFTGYRFIYPLLDGENYIGSVEASIPMVNVIESLYGLEPMRDYGFLLNRNVMESTVNLENQDHYQPSLINKDYVTDIDVFEITKSSSEMKDLYVDEDFLEMLTTLIVPKMKSQDSFIVPVNYQGKYYIVQFEQITDISGDPVGYIFTGGENRQLYDLARSKNLSFILTTIIYFILLLTIYYIKQRNDIISKLAMYDQLTGLYNRYVFFEFSKKVLEVSRRLQNPVCLAIMDIDNFKRVNDSFGHHIGDVVLKKIAQIVSQSTRSADVLARFGGEELILLMADSRLSDSREVAERIRYAIESFSFESVGQVTVSIGLIEIEDGEFLDAAIIRADQALYQAKANGRNQTVTK